MYAVDYTEATLANRNSGLLRNGLENRDVIEGIVFMKIKYKEAGMEFKCFHNRGHPERWSPKDPSDFNALERVTVLSDEVAERVGIYMTEPQ